MKTKITALMLSLTAVMASAQVAQGPVVSFGYDFDQQRGTSAKAQEARIGIAQKTRFGTFDGAVLGARNSFGSPFGNAGDNATGYELGYGNGFNYGDVGFKARVAYGRLNQVDDTAAGFQGRGTSYGKFGLEAAKPISGNLNGFVGYEHRNSFNDRLNTQNKYMFGVDYAVNKNVAARVGFGHTREAGGRSYNGIVTGVSYAF